MFFIALALIMKLAAFGEPILVERFCQNFVKISLSPSSSCENVGHYTHNLGNCFHSCMIHNGSSYMVARNDDTTECVCCQIAPSEDIYGPGNWTTYSFACPFGYTEITYSTTRACLQFVSSTLDYTTAVSDCEQRNGDLVKIDSIRMHNIFLDFLFNYTTTEERSDSVWIQGHEDGNSIWRFHDGTQITGFLRNVMTETNNPGEDRVRYSIQHGNYLDRVPAALYSYMCEYRFY